MELFFVSSKAEATVLIKFLVMAHASQRSDSSGSDADSDLSICTDRQHKNFDGDPNCEAAAKVISGRRKAGDSVKGPDTEERCSSSVDDVNGARKNAQININSSRTALENNAVANVVSQSEERPLDATAVDPGPITDGASVTNAVTSFYLHMPPQDATRKAHSRPKDAKDKIIKPSDLTRSHSVDANLSNSHDAHSASSGDTPSLPAANPTTKATDFLQPPLRSLISHTNATVPQDVSGENNQEVCREAAESGETPQMPCGASAEVQASQPLPKLASIPDRNGVTASDGALVLEPTNHVSSTREATPSTSAFPNFIQSRHSHATIQQASCSDVYPTRVSSNPRLHDVTFQPSGNFCLKRTQSSTNQVHNRNAHLNQRQITVTVLYRGHVVGLRLEEFATPNDILQSVST